MPTLTIDDDERSEITRRELQRASRTSGAARREALERVVLANMPVARSIARRYAGRGVADDELQQLAYLGLVAATARFDVSNQHDLLTFAVPWMTGVIRRHFRDQTWSIRPSRRVQELHQELSYLEGSGNGATSVQEAATTLGATPAEIREVLGARTLQRPRSLHDPATGSGTTTLAETVAAEETTTMRSADARLMLRPALRALTPRERHVLHRIYVDGWTQSQIGHELDLAQGSIARIHQSALRGLRRELGVAA